MIISKRTIIYFSGIVSILAIILLSAKIISGNAYRKQIPSLPELQSLSPSLKEQILDNYKKASHNPSSDNLGMMGMVFHSNSYYDKAAVCYSLAAKKDKDKWIWNYYLGCLNREMGDTKAELKNFRQVIKINRTIYLASYYEGECYQKLGLVDSAEIVFKNIIGTMDKNTIVKTSNRYDYFPLVTYSMYNLAKTYLNSKHDDMAEKTLLEIIDNNRAFGPAYRLLGNIYSTRGNESLSSHFLIRAKDLTVNPSPVDTLVDRLSLMSRSDSYLLKEIEDAEKNVFPEYALELVIHSLKYIPDNIYLISKAIELFLVSDMGSRALPYLDRHINYFQKDFDELKNVGDLLYQKGYYSQAMKYYSQTLNIRPEDNKVKSCIVFCLAAGGNKQQALDLINGNLDKNKNNPVVLADAVSLLLSLGEKEKAVACLKILLKISPSNITGLQVSGMLYEQDGKWKEALDTYTRAINSDPGNLTTLRLLGNLLVKQKIWDKAIIVFRKALEYNPNEPFILERLGTLLVTCSDPKLRNVSEGRDFCERAFIHTRSHSVTLISSGRSLAIAYTELNDKRNASHIIKMTIELAKKENIPPAYLDDLNNLLQQFNN